MNRRLRPSTSPSRRTQSTEAVRRVRQQRLTALRRTLRAENPFWTKRQVRDAAVMTLPIEFPLAWPVDRSRTARPVDGAFKTSLSQAVENAKRSFRSLGEDTKKPISAPLAVISSNVGGLSGRAPDDPAVTVYFQWDGRLQCVTCDRYKTVAHNVQAIHLLIEARTASEAEIKSAVKRLARAHHPDRPGGSNSKMAEINQAGARAVGSDIMSALVSYEIAVLRYWRGDGRQDVRPGAALNAATEALVGNDYLSRGHCTLTPKATKALKMTMTLPAPGNICPKVRTHPVICDACSVRVGRE